MIIVVGLLIKSLCSKRPCNSKMLLSFVAACIILLKLIGRCPPLLTWHIFQIIVVCLSVIVSACVLNQFNNHQLLFCALQSTITMCLKCMEKFTSPIFLAQISLIDDDFGITLELSLFITNIKKKFVVFWICSFFKKEDMKRKSLIACYVQCQTLNFKTFVQYFSFIGHEERLNIVKKYNRQSLYLMF